MQTQANIFSVSALNQATRKHLESTFTGIWVMGELSNFVTPASGHWYFTLKDESAQIKAAMFRGNNRSVRMQPGNGQQVMVRGRVSLYEPRGDYQLIVEQMEPAGDGLLKQQFEQLKAQLAAEGLFNQGWKKPLPHTIGTIGVVTSATGAAVHDILTVLKRRAPTLQVIIYPTAVQGQEAPSQVANAIAVANHRREVDVLIVGRGGGSLEDLWCFNEEVVARAIFASEIPVVSAVGHEVDVTISDFVADYRAATPSAAAEMVSPDQSELITTLQTLKTRLFQATVNQLSVKHNHIQLLEQKLNNQHPSQVLQRLSQTSDELQRRLLAAMDKNMAQSRLALTNLTSRFNRFDPCQRVENAKHICDDLHTRLARAMTQYLANQRADMELQCRQLDTVSPLATMARGYSITFHENDSVVKSAEELKQGQLIKSRLQDGYAVSEVQKVIKID